jgi:hypothetical protein
MKKPTNRFNVMVCFPDVAFGIQNRADVALSPEEVAIELEDFCARIRRTLARPAADRKEGQ